MTVLKTRRLTLRAAREDDLGDLFAIFSDPRAMRYWSTEPHGDPTVTFERVQSMIAAAAAPGGPTYFVIEKDGRAIGTCGMHHAPEVGFILHPDFWGQGLAREAMAAVIAHLWATTDLPALTADADPRNAASLALLSRLGFRESHRAERTFCIAGEWSDSVYLSLPRPGAVTRPE